MKKATMQDIADKLEVSRNTVSRALRGKSGVSESTKEEVRAVAEEIGYEYNSRSSQIYDGRKMKFILFSSSFALSQTSFFGIMIDELKDRVEADGNILEVIEVPMDNEELKSEWISTLKQRSKNIAGIYILSHITDEFIKEIIATDYPTILIDHHSPQLVADSILTQNEYGAYQLIEYLIKNNIREIGFIGDINFSPSYLERYYGYLNALEDYDIEINESFIISDVQEEQKSLFDRISKLDKLPQSWFCVNSGLAFILNTYLQSMNFSVPENFSIVCFDNTEFSRQASPPITCVGADLRTFGSLAHETMKRRMDNREQPTTQIRIIPDFFERDSVKKST